MIIKTGSYEATVHLVDMRVSDALLLIDAIDDPALLSAFDEAQTGAGDGRTQFIILRVT